MKQETRLTKSLRNFNVGMIFQVATLILNFITRTIFIHTLGVEYLGINGLFSNILTFLSLAELGIGNAIIYSMYKPLAKNDKKKLTALMKFYQKMYHIISIIIFVIGICLIPFLPYLVKVDTPIPNLTLYYFLFLLNSMASYLFAYKSSIIIADQQIYITKVYALVFLIIQFVLQVLILCFTKNYVLFLVAQILCTFGNNIMCAYKANKKYPFILEKEELSKKEKKDIFSNVCSIFIYKISGTILNNTDNILISVMLGTVFVGYYSNYALIISSLIGLVAVLFTSVNASVGNVNAEDNSSKKHEIFNVLEFLSFWIFGYFSVGLILLLNDFITVWLGKEFLLDLPVVISIVLNFYVVGILNPIWIYRDTTGLFKDTRTVSIILAILNLVLSIILGHFLGLFGILIATAISRLSTTFWYQPLMLYKKVFNKSCSEYFIQQLKYFLLVILAIVISYIFTKCIVGASVWNFILKGIILTIITNIVFFISLYKTKEWKYINDVILSKVINQIKKVLKLNKKRKCE